MKTRSCGGSICSPPGGGPGRAAGRGAARLRLGAVLWIAALAAPWAGALAGDYPLEILTLRARLPEELIPLLAPLAGPDGAVTGGGNALLVRAAPARLADIRRALETLDQPPRSLLIQVRQGGRAQAAGAAGRPGGVWAGAGTAARDLSQEVRTLDGRRAYIAVGQEQPVPYRETGIERRWGDGGIVVREGTRYRRAESGFYVVPRLAGDRVVLEIDAGTQTLDRRGGLASAAAGGQVSGRLGEWIPVGASLSQGEAEAAGPFAGARGTRREEVRMELRVLPLD